MQNDVFGRAGRSQRTRQVDSDRAGYASGNFVVLPNAGDFRVPNAVGEAIQRTGRARMRVRSENDLAGQRDSFSNDSVTNSCASSGWSRMQLNAEFFCNSLLPFSKVTYSLESLARNTRQTSGQCQVVGKCVNRLWVLYRRRPA